MKAIRSLILVAILLMTSFTSLLIFNFEPAAASDVFIGGSVTGTWDGSNVYHITSDTYVPLGGMLNITQGTNILFGASYKYEVFGTLNVIGTGANRVYFSSEKLSPAAGDWPGIHVDGGSATIKHAIIEYADVAVTVTSGTASLENCILRKNKEAFIEYGTATASLFGCDIHDNTISGMTLDATSKMDFIGSNLNMSGTTAGYPAVIQRSLSQFYGTNSTIENNFTYVIDTSGSSTAELVNCTINSTPNNFRFIGAKATVTIKNYLHVYVATDTPTGEEPIFPALVKVFEDQSLVESGMTNFQGEAMWMEITYAVYNGTNKYYPEINISIDYAQIFLPKRSYVNMSMSHWENFINRVPEFHFASEYSIGEDIEDQYFIDLWYVVEDDYDEDKNLTFKVEYNSGEDIGGKNIADMYIFKNRYLWVDLNNGSDNDNWTGQICFRINASDPLGSEKGMYHISETICINVTQVNDPPMWFDVVTFHVMEDSNFLDAIDVLVFVYDDQSTPDELDFSVKDYDNLNYDIKIDAGFNLDIVLKNEDISGYTNLTLCAKDPGGLIGNYTTRVVVDPIQDPPAVARKFSDLTMDEDTIYKHPVSLNQVFLDSDGDELYFSSDSNDHIDVLIDSDSGNVTFTPKHDWFGKNILSFFANDTFSNTSTQIEVTVLDINDPPGIPDIILPGEDEMRVYKEKEPITFSAYAYDPDIDLVGLDIQYIDDTLSYIWRRNTSNDVMSNQNNFTTDLPEGYHEINLTVTDSGGLESSVTLDIIVLGELKIPEVWHKMPLPEYYSFISNVRLEWNISADNSSLAYIRYDVFLGITDPPTKVVAEKIQSTSFTVKDLVDRTKYYWTIVPYLSTQKGLDMNGVWSFTYDTNVSQIYDVDLDVDKNEIRVYPGNNGSVNITIVNKGNMPDVYWVTITVEPLIKNMPGWTSKFLDGWGDGVYGFQSNEKEKLQLTIAVPDGFEMSGGYEISILVESDSIDESDSESVNLVILEKPIIKVPPETPEGNNLWIYLFIMIVVIVIAVIVILYAYNKRTTGEDVGDDEAEDEFEDKDKTDIPGNDVPVPPKGVQSMPPPISVGAVAAAEGPKPISASVKEQEPGENESPEKSEDASLDPGSVTCGSCGASIELSSNMRPLDVQCGECGNGFTLKG